MIEEQTQSTEEQAEPVQQEVQTNDVSRGTEINTEATPPVAERPEIIPEKFWNPETGEANIEDMAKSYAHLEKFASGKQEEVREAVIAELQAEAKEGLPENPKDYELPKLVEGLNEEIVEANPLTGWWREKCHEIGLDNEQFQSGINKYIDMMSAGAPDLNKEIENLGENGPERIDAVNAWASSVFPPEEFETVANTLGTSAQGIAALERIMAMNQSNMSKSETVAQPNRELTIADVKQMMNDKRYFDNRFRDPNYVREVDAAWARLQTAGKV
tara:strand:- start:4079 stop:4897 length:819 start_codon:yes stop_codon:yes gene_type:complete